MLSALLIYRKDLVFERFFVNLQYSKQKFPEWACLNCYISMDIKKRHLFFCVLLLWLIIVIACTGNNKRYDSLMQQADNMMGQGDDSA